MSLISTSLQESISTTTGLGATSPESVTTGVVTWLLGILAILAVVLIIAAGFLWMFSQGNEEKITKAQGILRNAIIGLLIIMAAYGITLYVIRMLASSTGTSLE